VGASEDEQEVDVSQSVFHGLGMESNDDSKEGNASMRSAPQDKF